MILLNPGPVTLSERVRASLLREDLCHRENEFAELTLNIKKKLLSLYNCENNYEAITLTGSGSCAVESMLSTFIDPEVKTLVVSNGVYGERIFSILKKQQKNSDQLQFDWLQSPNIELIEKEILQSKKLVSNLVVVHHETTTARLNDIKEIANLCNKHKINLFIDVVSSFGAEEIDFQNWNVAAVAGTANKCLHGIPGACFVIARKDLLKQKSFSNTLYLDVKNYFENQVNGWSPFTQSVQAYYALNEALDELIEFGGWMARKKNYVAHSYRIRQTLASLGVEPLISLDSMSCVMTSYQLPEYLSYEELHHFLKKNNYTIYAGQQKFASKIFRVAVMGALTVEIVEKFCNLFEELVQTKK